MEQKLLPFHTTVGVCGSLSERLKRARTRSSLLWSHNLEHRKGRERLPDLANEFPLANRPSLPTRKQMFPLESHRKAACCAVSYKARGSKNQYWYSGGEPFGPGARCDAYMELAKLGLECELRFGWFFPCLACVCPGRLDGGGGGGREN